VKRLLLLAPLALALTACNGQTDAPKISSDGVSPPGYKVIVLPYEGQGVRCIKMTRGQYVSGLTCDFAEFHHRFGWHDRYYKPNGGGPGG
jgi:hypothetical protein